MSEHNGFIEKVKERAVYAALQLSNRLRHVWGNLEVAAIEADGRDKLMRNAAKYTEQVAPTENEEAEEGVRIFAQELLSYMNENLTDFVRPLNINSDQMQALRLLLDAFKNKEGLVVEPKFIKSNFTTGQPMIQYHINVLTEQDAALLNAMDGLNKPGVRVYARFDWDVSGKRPHSLKIFVTKGFRRSGEIVLLSLPDEDINPELIKEHLKDKCVQSVGIYADGRQCNVESSFEVSGNLHELTTIYRFVGTFDGLDSQKSYRLYGSNLTHDERKTIREIPNQELTPAYARNQG